MLGQALQSAVEQKDFTIARLRTANDIAGLDISMQDFLGMQHGELFENTAHRAERLTQRHGADAQRFFERLAGEVRSRYEIRIVVSPLVRPVEEGGDFVG